MSYGPSSTQRIGDYERDNAVDALRDHMAAGRITPEELDDRLAIVLSAKTQADIDKAFTDLPADPDAIAGVSVWQASKRRPASARPMRVIQRWMIILTPLILLAFIIGWPFWWVVLVVWVLAFLLVNRAERTLERRAESGQLEP